MSFGSDNFSCVIFGEGGLPQQCGDELLDRGHRIVAVVSPDAAVPILESIRAHPLGTNAAIIGEVVAQHPAMVLMKTEIGGTLIR